MEFKNKNIIITGATSGIGKSLLVKLLKQGANVAFCGRSEQKMQKLLNEIKPYTKSEIYYEVFDLSEISALQLFVNNVFSRFNSIDFLFNNAGLNAAKDYVVDIKHNDLDYMMAVNFKAPFILLQHVGKQMQASKNGTIVNILSSVCLFNNERMAAYTASKAAFNAISKTMNKEMREHNVRVVSVYPGGVDTDFREMDRPDYLNVDETADIILANLMTAKTASLDDIVFRPMIEKNFQ